MSGDGEYGCLGCRGQGPFRLAGGICKVNVYTDVILAAKQAIADNPEAGYTDLCLLAEQAMRAATVKKLRLFGGEGRA